MGSARQLEVSKRMGDQVANMEATFETKWSECMARFAEGMAASGLLVGEIFDTKPTNSLSVSY